LNNSAGELSALRNSEDWILHYIKTYLVALCCGIIMNNENWLNAKPPTLKPGPLSKEMHSKLSAPLNCAD